MENNTSNLQIPTKTNINTVVKDFTSLILDTANISIGRSPGKLQRPRVPWWNGDIKKSIQDKNRALNIFQSSKS